MDNELNRFIAAQVRDYDRALAEIRNGKKLTHWMWYIFPQLRGLGSSAYAVLYGITDIQEAYAYLKDPVLGPRLIEISRALLALPGDNAREVMGSPDDMKLRSCMTLFAGLPGADPVFTQVLDKFFGGEKDGRTLAILKGE
jgi:uncharacterized protein (DUF1810 family)